MSTNKAWGEEVQIAFNTLRQTKEEVLDMYGKFAWNQDKMTAAEIVLFQNFDAELTKLIQWINEARVRRQKLNVSCLTYGNLKQIYGYLVRELDVDIDAIPFHEKDEYLWRDSYAKMSIDERHAFIRNCAILIQEIESLRDCFLEEFARIHKEQAAIGSATTVTVETEEPKAAPKRVVGLGAVRPVAKKATAAPKQPVSIFEKIKNTAAKVCATIKNTAVKAYKTILSSVEDMMARVKAQIAAVLA